MSDGIVERIRAWSPSQCWSCGEWGCTNASRHPVGCERDCECDEHYDDTVCPSPCRECDGDDVCNCDCHVDYSGEAADEIERLRTANKNLHRTIERLGDHILETEARHD